MGVRAQKPPKMTKIGHTYMYKMVGELTSFQVLDLKPVLDLLEAHGDTKKQLTSGFPTGHLLNPSFVPPLALSPLV